MKSFSTTNLGKYTSNNMDDFQFPDAWRYSSRNEIMQIFSCQISKSLTHRFQIMFKIHHKTDQNKYKKKLWLHFWSLSTHSRIYLTQTPTYVILHDTLFYSLFKITSLSFWGMYHLLSFNLMFSVHAKNNVKPSWRNRLAH